eukprot:scaffold2735_cov107-Skeletonema_marinoi.AAC.2
MPIFLWIQEAMKLPLKKLQESTTSESMSLRGPEITVKDSTANHNGDDGIRVIADSSATNVIFEGVVSSYLKKKHGIAVEKSFDGTGTAPYEAEVTVKGVLNTYLNGRDGLFIRKDTIVNDFTVEAEGSFSSCNNSQGKTNDYDIGIGVGGNVDANNNN